MHWWRIASLLVLTCVAWVGTCGAQGFATPAAVDDAWVKAMKANDVAAVVKCYAPDAVAWLPDTPAAQGTEAIRKTYQSLLGANTVKNASLTNVREKMMGSVAVRWGSFSLTLAPKAGGEPAVLKGRFSEVLERRDGSWVYVVDHASGEPPPTAGAK